jgi:outer membrane lipoprotein-sorting protein
LKVFILALFLLKSAHAADFLPANFLIEYTESFRSISKGGNVLYQGRFSFSYPDKFRLDVTDPDPSSVVSNGVKSWRYTPPFIEGEQGEVEISKANELPVTKFLKTLKRGLQKNPSFKTSVKGSDITLTMNEPWRKNLGIKQVILKLKDASKSSTLADVSELEIFYSNNNQMKWNFKEFKAQPSFEKNHFDFQIPPKTKVVEN